MKNRKGQEEIVGFVLIMVIVAVVFLVLLGISVRTGDGGLKDSRDVYQFLESSAEYTTDCQIRSTEYGTLGDVIGKCLDNERCLNEMDSCDVLNKTLKEIMDSSWNVGEESKIKGYLLNSVYQVKRNDVEARDEEIISIEEGDCLGSVIGATYLIPSFPGKIVNSLKICY